MSMIIPELDELVAADHRYRAILALFNWTDLTKPLRNNYSKQGRKGYAVEQGFKCLFLQFLEDRSDRQMESLLRDSLAAKFFCGFGLVEQTPDHSYFGAFRERIGTYQLSNIFKKIVASLKKQGLIREFYTFVDASKIIASVDTWKARDKAIADAENQQRDDNDKPTMNNKNSSSYSSDPDARYGAKGKNDIWFGYKMHVGADMHQGLISKVAVTGANVHDGAALKHVRPSKGAVLADKIYNEFSLSKTRKWRSRILGASDSKWESEAGNASQRLAFYGYQEKLCQG